MFKLSDLTLKQKIGQLVICGFNGDQYSLHAKKLIEEYDVGNIILFGHNYTNPSQIKKLNRDLYDAIMKQCGVMPFISIDQEGGSVTRMMHSVTFPPSQMSCGATQYPHSSYEVGKMIARDMIMLGMNMDFAPTFDINHDLENIVTNIRSYSSNPVRVGEMVKESIKGMNEYGVLATGKHFPGSDKEKVDTHLESCIVHSSKEYMHDVGLLPYRMNIDVPCIMVTHAIFTSYDTIPASLSKPIITDLLRQEMNYKGLVVTDGLGMRAISDHYSMKEASVKAILAGCNFALLCHEGDDQEEGIEGLYQAALSGELPMEVIDERVQRILDFKNKAFSYYEKYFLQGNEYKIKEKNNEIAQRIVDESLTLIQGKEPIFHENTTILTPKAVVSCEVEDDFYERSLKKSLLKVFPNRPIFEFDYEKEIILEQNQNLVIFSYDCANNKKQLDYINQLLVRYPEATVISLKGPIDYKLFKNLHNYLCLYEYTPISIRTIIKYIKNEIKPIGKLPNGLERENNE